MLLEVRFPNRLSARLRHNKGDLLALVDRETFEHHQADNRLAQADAIAEEGAVVFARDLQELAIAFSLIAIEQRPDLRLGALPIAGRDLAALEVLVQGLGPDLEGRERLNVPFDHA